jgi:hypothetical protein
MIEKMNMTMFCVNDNISYDDYHPRANHIRKILNHHNNNRE